MRPITNTLQYFPSADGGMKGGTVVLGMEARILRR